MSSLKENAGTKGKAKPVISYAGCSDPREAAVTKVFLFLLERQDTGG